MTPETIRRFDQTLGRLLCALLTPLARLAGPPKGPPRRVVFVKLIEMGSSVLAAPAFAEAARRVGRDNLFVVVFERNRPILDVLGCFPAANILTLRDTSLPAFVADLWRARRRLRRERVDTAIDLEGLTRSSAVVAWFTGARRRVGYHNFTSEGPYRGRLFTHELNYTFERHVSVGFLTLVRALDAEPGQVPLLKAQVALPELPRHVPSAADRDSVRAALARAGVAAPGRPLVVLNPNCSDLLPLRRWPEESFVELGRRLLEAYPAATVVLTGSAEERLTAAAMAPRIGPPPRCVSLAGDTRLPDLLALYAAADLLVSNDSGPCHFAALTNIPILALFGPETPRAYGPLSPRARALTADLACSPCINVLNHRFSPCTDNRCMRAIGVDRVFAEAQALLRNPSGVPAARPDRG